MPLLSTFGAASARSFGGIGAAAAGAGLDIDEAFSTYLYDGTGSAQTITNGIDLSGEGGLVWFRDRDNANGNFLFDTERGATKRLRTHGTFAENTVSTGLTAFNSNGFTIGSNAFMNGSNNAIASWTFRKAPKFFDIVTWTGNGTENRTISHNLGSVPGMIIVKGYSLVEDWNVYHRGIGNAKYLQLNSTAAAANVGTGPGGADLWMSTDPTSTTFKIDEHNRVNANGESYVAYLFAHNDGDGGFGPDADQDVIKCGSYTGNGSSQSINIGFESQWVLVKGASGSLAPYTDWMLFDNMRGIVSGGNDPDLRANKSSAEATSTDYISLTATGLDLTSNAQVNANGDTYIYMAIRRGPLAEPTSATDVFTTVLGDGSGTPSIKTSNHVTDFGIAINKTGGGSVVGTRLLGTKQLQTHTSNAESTNSFFNWDFMNGWHTWTGLNTNYINWNWKRAPSFFDVVAYTGTGSNRTITHNLGVVPEMMWLKERSGTFDWNVYHKDLGGADKYLKLNGTDAVATATNRFNNTHPTASVFSLGTSSALNDSGATQIAYLFASVAGVSKVGSVAPTGSALTVDCGFSNGARFVLMKRTDSTGEWFVWDSVRGIVSGNDPWLALDSTSSETTNTDYIDPHSSGFTLTSNFYGSGSNFIFYAIA